MRRYNAVPAFYKGILPSNANGHQRAILGPVARPDGRLTLAATLL